MGGLERSGGTIEDLHHSIAVGYEDAGGHGHRRTVGCNRCPPSDPAIRAKPRHHTRRDHKQVIVDGRNRMGDRTPQHGCPSNGRGFTEGRAIPSALALAPWGWLKGAPLRWKRTLIEIGGSNSMPPCVAGGPTAQECNQQSGSDGHGHVSEYPLAGQANTGV